MEAASPNLQNGPVDWRPREEPMPWFEAKSHLLQNSPLLGGGQPFVLFKPSTDWMRPTHGGQSALLKVYRLKC